YNKNLNYYSPSKIPGPHNIKETINNPIRILTGDMLRLSKNNIIKIAIKGSIPGIISSRTSSCTELVSSPAVNSSEVVIFTQLTTSTPSTSNPRTDAPSEIFFMILLSFICSIKLTPAFRPYVKDQ